MYLYYGYHTVTKSDNEGYILMKELIYADNAPAAIGPYSHATKVGNLIYTAGQIPLDPTTMQIVSGDITDQTRQAIENLKAVLEAAGSDLAHVLKVTVLLSDMTDYQKMNDVYAVYFDNSKPARSAFAVAALPLGASIEIEAVAIAKQ